MTKTILPEHSGILRLCSCLIASISQVFDFIFAFHEFSKISFNIIFGHICQPMIIYTVYIYICLYILRPPSDFMFRLEELKLHLSISKLSMFHIPKEMVFFAGSPYFYHCMVPLI